MNTRLVERLFVLALSLAVGASQSCTRDGGLCRDANTECCTDGATCVSVDVFIPLLGSTISLYSQCQCVGAGGGCEIGGVPCCNPSDGYECFDVLDGNGPTCIQFRDGPDGRDDIDNGRDQTYPCPEGRARSTSPESGCPQPGPGGTRQLRGQQQASKEEQDDTSATDGDAKDNANEAAA